MGPDRLDSPDEGLSALTSFFVDDGTVGDTLLRVAELARRAAPADMVGLTMLVEGTPRTGVFTDPVAVEVDEAQYQTGSGPCIDAFQHRRTNRIDSTVDEARWPQFCARAAGHGIRSTLSLPVVARDEALGALNLYSRSFAGFDEESALRLDVFARQTAIVLSNAQVYWDARNLSENLDQAMRSRAMIDYAVGILMAHGGRSPEDGFALLVRASQRENRKLRDIAADIVAHAAAREVPPAGS